MLEARSSDAILAAVDECAVDAARVTTCWRQQQQGMYAFLENMQ
jgi:hypothetical protein